MSDISDKHAQLAGAGLALGAATGAETACTDGQGRFRHYAGGSIYWHPATGAHEVHGAIRDRWQALGRELSWLGYPTTDETAIPGGRRSRFQNGRIDWSGATGAVDGDGVDYVAYTTRDHAGHQAECNRLEPLGYRPVALNMYGAPQLPFYAAVWVKRANPTWSMAHGRSYDQLRQWADAKALLGLHPTIIAATGSGAAARFAMVVERVPGALPFLRIGLRHGPVGDPTTLQHWNRWSRENGYVLTSLATYGDAAHPLVAAIWQPNATATGWSTDVAPTLPEIDERAFRVQTAHGARPFLVERSEGLAHVVSVYRDDAIGPWLARGNLTAAEFAGECDARKAEGYFPQSVAGSGPGFGERFNVIFAKREQPLPCRFVATGVHVPTMASFDEAVSGYMRRNDIRAGTLAVVKGGKLRLARGYTWAPPTYPITQPTTLFRIGSISKSLTNILVHQLVERGDDFAQPVTLATRVQEYLSLAAPDGMPELNDTFGDITVAQLLAHWSGVSGNFAHLDPEVALAFDVPLPITSKRQIAALLMTRPQEFAAGAQFSYANSGYLLLAAVIEHATGRPWFDVLRTHVLNPLGITRPRPSGSLLTQRVAGEALYHDANLTLVRSVMTPDRPLVRDAYGNPNLAVGDAVGGMAFGAADLAKLYAALLPSVAPTVLARDTIDDVMWPPFMTGVPAPGWMDDRVRDTGVRWIGHNGGLANMQAFAFARIDDDVVLAVAFNKGANGFEPAPEWHDLIDDVPAFPVHDLFPSVGIPSFT